MLALFDFFTDVSQVNRWIKEANLSMDGSAWCLSLFTAIASLYTKLISMHFSPVKFLNAAHYISNYPALYKLSYKKHKKQCIEHIIFLFLFPLSECYPQLNYIFQFSVWLVDELCKHHPRQPRMFLISFSIYRCALKPSTRVDFNDVICNCYYNYIEY